METQWTAYRKSILEHAGISIFAYGNKGDPSGNIVPSGGMREEFDIGCTMGVRPIPLGFTGFMAKAIWDEVWEKFPAFYPDATPMFKEHFQKLGEPTTTLSDAVPLIVKMIELLKRD